MEKLTQFEINNKIKQNREAIAEALKAVRSKLAACKAELHFPHAEELKNELKAIEERYPIITTKEEIKPLKPLYPEKLTNATDTIALINSSAGDTVIDVFTSYIVNFSSVRVFRLASLLGIENIECGEGVMSAYRRRQYVQSLQEFANKNYYEKTNGKKTGMIIKVHGDTKIVNTHANKMKTNPAYTKKILDILDDAMRQAADIKTDNNKYQRTLSDAIVQGEIYFLNPHRIDNIDAFIQNQYVLNALLKAEIFNTIEIMQAPYEQQREYAERELRRIAAGTKSKKPLIQDSYFLTVFDKAADKIDQRYNDMNAKIREENDIINASNIIAEQTNAANDEQNKINEAARIEATCTIYAKHDAITKKINSGIKTIANQLDRTENIYINNKVTKDKQELMASSFTREQAIKEINIIEMQIPTLKAKLAVGTTKR